MRTTSRTAKFKKDYKREAKGQLEQTLLGSLLEGKPQEANPEFWATLRNELGERLKALRDP